MLHRNDTTPNSNSKSNANTRSASLATEIPSLGSSLFTLRGCTSSHQPEMAMAQTARTATARRPTHDYHRPTRSKSANPAQLRPLSGIHGAAVSSRPRYVPPFSIQSQQKNTVVIDGPIHETAPKTASARSRVPNPKSALVCLFGCFAHRYLFP